MLLQVTYYALVARCYQQVDMSLAYPMMRGCAPILVALAGAVLGERLPPSAWLGVLLVSGGILCMARGARGGQLRLPLLTAAMIASLRPAIRSKVAEMFRQHAGSHLQAAGGATGATGESDEDVVDATGTDEPLPAAEKQQADDDWDESARGFHTRPSFGSARWAERAVVMSAAKVAKAGSLIRRGRGRSILKT